jgi:WD40 repeat protein
LIGTGDGTVAVLKGRNNNFKRTSKKAKVTGSVTALAVRGVGHQFFVGTAVSQMYKFKFDDFTFEMPFSGHHDPVNDLCFPRGYSDVLITCSHEEIRLWNIVKGEELLRIKVANITCNAVDITPDGKTIVSGWDDGRIRCFYPQSGKPKYIVENAGGGSVTALAVFNNNQKVIGGTSTGNLTIWELPVIKTTKGPTYLTKFESLKQHRAQITHIHIRKNDSECITSSRDGTCITWDLVTLARIHMVRVNTLFMNVCFHPDEFQFITSGTDRRITFWEKYDASKIRELEGSKSGSVNSMDIVQNGQYFVSAGDDKLVKVWLYDEGNCTHIGVGHSAQIVGVKVAPNNQFIISISSDGAILKWRFPFC